MSKWSCVLFKVSISYEIFCTVSCNWVGTLGPGQPLNSLSANLWKLWRGIVRGVFRNIVIGVVRWIVRGFVSFLEVLSDVLSDFWSKVLSKVLSEVLYYVLSKTWWNVSHFFSAVCMEEKDRICTNVISKFWHVKKF